MNSDVIHKEKSSKKELVYIFIIIDLVILTVCLVTWKFKDSQDIINQISLVSSVSSILLALVAIIYAFFQTLASTKQNDQMQSTLSNINKKITELGDIKDEFSQIKDEFNSFRESSKSDKLEILGMISQYQELIRQNNESLIDNLKEQQISIPKEVEQSVLEKSSKQLVTYIDTLKDQIVNSSRSENEILIGNEVFRFIERNYKKGELVPVMDVVKFISHSFKYTYRTSRILTARILDELSHPQSILEKKITEQGQIEYLKQDEFPGGPTFP